MHPSQACHHHSERFLRRLLGKNGHYFFVQLMRQPQVVWAGPGLVNPHACLHTSLALVVYRPGWLIQPQPRHALEVLIQGIDLMLSLQRRCSNYGVRNGKGYAPTA